MLSNKTNDDSLATELVTAFIESGKEKPSAARSREAVIALLAAVVADAERIEAYCTFLDQELNRQGVRDQLLLRLEEGHTQNRSRG